MLGSSDFLDEIEAKKTGWRLFGPIGAQKGPNERHFVDTGCLKDLDERGVLCAIMTDGPARNPWMILAQAGEAVRFGCPAERVLRMITINAATILGCEDRIGSLEVGKDADLVLFDQNPVVSTAAKAPLTMVDGEVVAGGKRSFLSSALPKSKACPF
ncbi:MAG: amidohydrolase family protein [Holdemania filiformis]